MGDFIPPRPPGQAKQPNLIKRFFLARKCSLRILYERSYNIKMGQVRLLSGRWYIVNEPSLVRRILVDRARKFLKSRIMHGGLAPLIGNGIFISNGEVWERQRRMIDPAFDARGLEEVFPLMTGAVAAMHSRLDAAVGKPVEIDVETTHVTADIIFRTIFSEPLERADAHSVFDAFNRYQKAAPSFAMYQSLLLPDFLLPSRRRAKRAAGEIRELLSRFVRPRFDSVRRGERDPNNDILGALLNARDPVTGYVFEFEDLIDQVAVLFLAGHETSASALGWALYLIAKCPHLQDRLRAEAIDVLGARPAEYADIRKLKFTRDVFRETLRLYPPVGFIMREATEQEKMRDKMVCPADTLVVSPWLIHRHRTYWERPDAFDPDRFGTASARESLKTSYLPFSLGPRACPGAGFAMQEATLILASLFRDYCIENAPGHEPIPIGRLTIRSANGIRLLVTRR